jgi:hypothetical protein
VTFTSPAGRRAAALTAGLAAVIYALGAPHGWASPATLTGFVAGGVLIVGFAVLDRRAADRILPPRPTGARSLPTGAALMLGATALLAGTLFVTTFFLQQQLHASPLRTGLDYLPFAVAIGLAAHAGPHLLARLGSRVVGTGATLAIAAGALLLAVASGRAGFRSPGSAGPRARGGCRPPTAAGPACRRCWPRAFRPLRR